MEKFKPPRNSSTCRPAGSKARSSHGSCSYGATNPRGDGNPAASAVGVFVHRHIKFRRKFSVALQRRSIIIDTRKLLYAAGDGILLAELIG